MASQTETVGAATTEKVYDYDVRGRLASVKTDGVVTEWYAYDRNGNRTNSMNGAAVYDAQDRLLANASTTFAYNLNGSLTNRLPTAYSLQSTAFSYDLFGQLASVTLPDGRVVSYDRDALSRITAKRIDGVIVKGWIYKDALKPIAETDASGNVVSFFVYGTSALSPDTMDKDGVTYRFIRDVQGSVRLVVDSATGTIVQRLDYDSFGNVLLDTAPGFQPFGFQSGLYDPDTALVQFGARWYDANTGRWLSKDPILLEGGLNLYVFCGNDPVNYADPWGLCEDGSNEGLIGSAGVFEQAGQVRYNYNSFVAKLRATGTYSCERDALRTFFNQPGNSTALSRGVAGMYRWEQGLNGTSRSLANPTATAPAVNNAGAMAKWGGRGLIVVGAGLSVYDIATAPDPCRATVQNGSATVVGAGGGSAGAWAGAGIGTAVCPGPGTAIGAALGAIVGGVGGGILGHALGTAAYDANYGPNSPW